MTSSKIIIGLTGGIGSGKTAASDYFASLGIEVVDADIVARKVVEPSTPALTQIIEHFGPSIVLANGELDRAQLRSIIFNNADQKDWLEKLLHPLIRQEINQQLDNSCSPYTVFVSPLLLETDQQQLCTRILVIDVPEQTQVERTSQRDNNDIEQIKRIIASQIDRKPRLEKANDIVDNSQGIAQLQQKLDKLHQYYLSLTNQ